MMLTPLVLPPFPDVESIMIEWAEENFPELRGPTPGSGLHVDSTLPTADDPRGGLSKRLNFVRISEVAGGYSDRFTDFPLVEVDIFAPTRSVAYDLAKGIRARLLGGPQQVGAVTLDRIREQSRFVRIEWADENIRRFFGVYQVALRRSTERQ